MSDIYQIGFMTNLHIQKAKLFDDEKIYIYDHKI